MKLPTRSPKNPSVTPPTIGEVLAQEFAQVAMSRNLRLGSDDNRVAPSENAVGLAFSGGGIRSATFNLGVLQALSKKELLHEFDYLSTVSGGGYIGGWLMAWMHHQGKSINQIEDLLRQPPRSSAHAAQLAAEPIAQARQIAAQAEELRAEAKKNPTQAPELFAKAAELEKKAEEFRAAAAKNPAQAADLPEVHFLRDYSNYLTPRKGFLGADFWAFTASYLRNTILNQIILVLALLSLLFIPRTIVYGLHVLELLEDFFQQHSRGFVEE